MLAAQLPDNARVWGLSGWGVDQELAAQNVEISYAIVRAIALANGAKKSRVKPLHIPRPDEWRKQKQKSTASAWVEFAKGLMKGGMK